MGVKEKPTRKYFVDGKFIRRGIPINKADEPKVKKLPKAKKVPKAKKIPKVKNTPKVKNVTASDGPAIDTASFSPSPVVTSHDATLGHAPESSCRPELVSSEASYVSPHIVLDPDLDVTYLENLSRFHSKDATSDLLGAGASTSQSGDVWTPEIAALFANYWRDSPTMSVQEPSSGSEWQGTIVEQPENGPMLSGVPERQVEESQSWSTQSITVPPLLTPLPAPNLSTESSLPGVVDYGMSALGSSSPLESNSILDLIPPPAQNLSTEESLSGMLDYMSALESSSPVESSSIDDIIESPQPD